MGIGILDVLSTFGKILGLLVVILMSLAVVAFLFGIVRYMFSAGSAEKRAEGARFMVYGVIALFVMVSLWGLVALLQNTVFQNQTNTASLDFQTEGPQGLMLSDQNRQ